MRRQVSTLLALASLIVVMPATVYAANDQLRQKILPLNCVFEEVNDGLGSLYYLTPEECGVVVQPPQTVPQSSPSNAVYIQTPLVEQDNTTGQPLVGSLNVRAVLPWQPIVAVVEGDGTVVVGSQPARHQAEGSSLLDAPGYVFGKIGEAMSPTTAKVAVALTACTFIIVVLLLVLL